MPGVETVTAVLACLWLIARIPLFLVMFWLRLPVLLVCNLISGPMLFAWLFAWYAFPEKTAMVWGCAAFSFVAFFVSWLYDVILMLISPFDMLKTLGD